jgi:hypothetical protein
MDYYVDLSKKCVEHSCLFSISKYRASLISTFPKISVRGARKRMKFKKPVAILSVLMFSAILISSANAATFPNLPSTQVTITQGPLTAYSYPFASQLSGVPAGYDVTNAIYVGWCVDLVGVVTRGSPGYPVLLYSSLSPLSPALPAALASIPWDQINYILNHKTGSGTDIQEAIWYFVNGNAWPTSSQLPGWPYPLPPTTNAQDMVDDALANGVGYVPGPGEIVAVICVPTDTAVQYTIIELRKPGEYEGLTPGFWKTHPELWTGYSTDQTFYDVFGVYITINAKGNDPGIYNPTLIEAIAAKGGVNEEKTPPVYDALARHAVAALLNAAHPDVTYPLTEQEIIDAVALAISNGDTTDAEPLKNMLDMYNNAGGGIDAHGNPI